MTKEGQSKGLRKSDKKRDVHNTKECWEVVIISEIYQRRVRGG